jgi:hypothetical protein
VNNELERVNKEAAIAKLEELYYPETFGRTEKIAKTINRESQCSGPHSSAVPPVYKPKALHL